ncbi:DUF805 domain-containing protein [Novosphingobium mangrovi (ex Hu et al. 2023)]|uniref:DUF805 domain-containing protein n=1 Tax=Novosphingobium mangrovi (ex Hu et al. 2023) TaxID=2930094 RepID=A0ABT0A7B9_9SPHN|nr:DUF805 domain-containing protein [Novosphingobium mangrovi (ex Hu et al. 2023)]MCJ1959088.1 DUF805 domain-containing protein [Novosphingobium mangrovi (ex Hu et al. 2023)]
MIAYHIRNLARLSGREGQRSFWLWFALVAACLVAFGAAVAVPIFSATFARMERFALEHPENSTISRGPGHVRIEIEGPHPEFMPDMDAVLTLGAVATLIAVFLLGAAVVRRLHDGNRTGRWALLPVPFYVMGLALSYPLFSAARQGEVPGFGSFALLMLSNLGYLGALATLLIFLALPGTEGPNHFGDAPEG